MRHVETIIVGAGQAGLALSRELTRLRRDHVVLERGRVGERWHSERWDSLRLLTPNWMSRLPGWCYRGNDPDGYMLASDVSRYLEGYASSFGAPVESNTVVHAVEPCAGGYRIATSRGAWQAQAVVIATGHCDVPLIPPMARHLPASIHQVTPSDYRNPSSIPEG